MVMNSVALSLKAPLLNRFAGFTRGSVLLRPSLQAALTNPLHVKRIDASFFSHPCSSPSNFSNAHVFKGLGHHQGTRFGKLGSDLFRFSAVSGGSDGGAGGYGGDSGGKGGNSGGGGGGESGGDNWSFLSWYLALLAKYPVSVKAVTSALLTLIGDLICQLVIEKVPSIDLKRTFTFSMLGLVLVGPTLHFWYLYLSKLVSVPGTSGAALRLILDQFFFSPAFIGIFLATLVTLEGRSSDVVPKLQQEWFSSVLANWKLWIPFQFLNFRFVPQQFQVLAANFIALIWNVILSFKAHKEIQPR